VLKPFWVRFSEGLADLAVHIIELKAKKRWPGLSNATYEIVAKAPGSDEAGQASAEDDSQPSPARQDQQPDPEGASTNQPAGHDWTPPR
jgi:hypothetical protein